MHGQKNIKLLKFGFLPFFMIGHTTRSIIIQPKWRIKPLEYFVTGSATLQNLCPVFSKVLAKRSVGLLGNAYC